MCTAHLVSKRRRLSKENRKSDSRLRIGLTWQAARKRSTRVLTPRFARASARVRLPTATAAPAPDPCEPLAPAGRRDASTPTTRISSTPPAYTAGSQGSVSKSRITISRASPTAMTILTTSPTDTCSTPCRTMKPTTSLAVAPTAIRMPTSRLRRLTRNAARSRGPGRRFEFFATVEAAGVTCGRRCAPILSRLVGPREALRDRNPSSARTSLSVLGFAEAARVQLPPPPLREGIAQT